jgi:glycosyltransferase involved in cell wall biosynthesis
MRVAHVITRLIVGGAQENTLATVHGLRTRPGYQVQLFSGPTAGPEGSLENSVIEVKDLHVRVPDLIRPIHPWRDLLALRHLTRLFRQASFDVVHTHSGKAGLLGRLAARNAGVPLIIHSIHGPSFGNFQGPIPNALFARAERWAGRLTDHFVCVADAMRDQYLAAGIGSPRQYTRVFSGFRLEPYLQARPDPALRRRLGLGEETFVVGKIARLFKLKGHDDLLAVAPALVAACPSIRFLLVGDGAWRERLETQVRRRGLQDHFVFAGLLPPEAIPSYISLMDVLVHLSRREGLPRALPQAMAVGKPVIAYDCDGAREVCLAGKTGFLIPPGDLEKLGRRVLELQTHSDLRHAMGERGQALVKTHFPVQKMVDALDNLYRALLSNQAPRSNP